MRLSLAKDSEGTEVTQFRQSIPDEGVDLVEDLRLRDAQSRLVAQVVQNACKIGIALLWSIFLTDSAPACSVTSYLRAFTSQQKQSMQRISSGLPTARERLDILRTKAAKLLAVADSNCVCAVLARQVLGLARNCELENVHLVICLDVRRRR